MHRLELNGIEKRFGDRIAVQSTELCLENGVYGLLGENGAGKTTLMRMICGILKPDRGSVCCDGMDIRRMGKEYRGLLGYLPQDFGYYGDFSVWRFLHYMAALKLHGSPEGPAGTLGKTAHGRAAGACGSEGLPEAEAENLLGRDAEARGNRAGSVERTGDSGSG